MYQCENISDLLENVFDEFIIFNTIRLLFIFNTHLSQYIIYDIILYLICQLIYFFNNI